MSGFKALNIESDDESDIEVDDTKELQIEDALKLYQNALKYHAEGPVSFGKAEEAYRQLFESEIFKYPESQPELRRAELYDPLTETDDLWEDAGAGAVVTTGGLDTGPSTLPQILYLSYKNYAQFRLEHLTARSSNANVTISGILPRATAALEHFVKALDKDDTDLDLWRRTAAVGRMLDSRRIARFCLEAILESDDEGLSGVLSLPGLEEGLAAEQLHEMVGQLDDQLSVLQSPLSVSKRRVLSKMLKQRLKSYDNITAKEITMMRHADKLHTCLRQPQRLILKAPLTWADLGDTLLRQQTCEQRGTAPSTLDSAIAFDLGSIPKSLPSAIEAPVRPVFADNPFQPPEASVTWLSNSVRDQFPGLDGGKPTVQPAIAPADESMRQVAETSAESGTARARSSTITLPSRKRSGDVAGLQDGNDEGRTRTKRARARDSNLGVGDSRQSVIEANLRWEYEQQLNEFQAADDWVFETVQNLFERIGIVGFDAGKEVRLDSTSSPDVPSRTAAMDGLRTARSDIRLFLDNYTDQLARVLTQGGESLESAQRPSITNLSGSANGVAASKLTSSLTTINDEGLSDFLETINGGWYLTQEVAYKWVCALLHSRKLCKSGNLYDMFTWPETLKTMLVRTLVTFDESIYYRARIDIEQTAFGPTDGWSVETAPSLADMVETIFELHLDIYMLIKEPQSGVLTETITAQRDRLQRWSELAHEVMRPRSAAADLTDMLSIRFLWATTFTISAFPDVSQDHVIECMKDLRATLVAIGEPVLHLPNNAVMPEISVAALDREISRLTTKDFFLKVTDKDLRDPVAVIESLEPLLHALDTEVQVEDFEMLDGAEENQQRATVSPELVHFLQSSDASVRLLLWQRLRDAYLAIEYKPMVVSCYFRMMRILLDELRAPATTELPLPERQIAVLQSFRLLQDMTSKIITIVQNTDDALELVDEMDLRSAITSFGEILQLVQVFNVFEDALRVGQTQPPMLPNGLPVAVFWTMSTGVQEMQLHIWLILYALLKEAIYQNSDLYPTPAEDKFDFLRCVHRNLGIRGICGMANRIFVRVLKDEFMHMTHIDGYDSEQAQVLHDLYGLNCFLNPSYELMEHHCTHDAFLDRGVAMQAVDLLMSQASKLPIKDLVKHSLRDTIEKVHGVVPRKKPSEAILRNRELYRAYLKSPINPLDLFNALQGDRNQLPISPVPKEDALLASKGWFFLMGQMSLTRFRSQKRTAPTPIEEVEIAIAFFMQDLEYSMENWETWFRLAQAYDTKIEESIVWSAEKLNNSMSELVQMQRAAIHCYTMACALAYRSAELAFETSDKMTELYADFATRLYSSSRAPFDMLPFALDDVEKFVSLDIGVGKGKPHSPLRAYTAWKLAKVLLGRALQGRPKSWQLRYLLGKCLWKMHAASDDIRRNDLPPSAQQVLDTFIQTIKLIPKKKDSREKREPILEPHYKLVTIVHKVVTRGELCLDQAEEALDQTPYARRVEFPQEFDGWVPFILAVLKHLRGADKSNWHHRMIARAAQIIYDESDSRADVTGLNRNLGALGAKHELTQQLFTKTMVLQVWRPECERAGRHFVYTARYTRFFVKILEQLKDRPSLEQLAKRVRRRPHDVFEHNLVWQDICIAYLRLLRNYAALSEGLETLTFSNIAHEDFLARKEPLERWMQDQDTGNSAALDVLREVQELKKINQSLMKPGLIDDLIGDAYAYLFNHMGKQLWDEERRAKLEEEARRPPPTASSPARNPMMSLNHLMNLDGGTDSTVKTEPPTEEKAPAPAQPDPPARKKIGVGRREIRTCAEACYQKTGPARLTAPPGVRVQVVIDNSRAAGDTSAPGSIHDSADDESELSELEEVEEEDDQAVKEEEPARPIFPGLTTAAPEGSESGQDDHHSGGEDVDMEDAAEKSPETAEAKTSGRVEGVDGRSVGVQ